MSVELIRGFWRSTSFWEKSNVLWIGLNILATLLVLFLCMLRPLYYVYSSVKQYFWLKFFLPKKDLEYHKQLVRNYRNYRANSKKKPSWLGEKIFAYSLRQVHLDIVLNPHNYK